MHMDDVQPYNINTPVIYIIKILSLKDNSIFKVLYFSNDSYDSINDISF